MLGVTRTVIPRFEAVFADRAVCWTIPPMPSSMHSDDQEELEAVHTAEDEVLEDPEVYEFVICKSYLQDSPPSCKFHL